MREPGRNIEYLPGMQERGGTQAIGALKFSDCDPVGQTQTVERITGLNVINHPTGRRAAGQWSLGAHGRDVNNHAGNQLRR